ncbi:hypothetical protein DPMN_124479 [Dreissena polymorpha]|uniref:U1-type domain-containing protein n=1 Tax=Dreissena polymorpha TaxID=45954 RepID=A0A9D4GWG7_DREPO|nr:hypothetical protein DPMN_124479 [Dreissena polymorpha]
MNKYGQSQAGQGYYPETPATHQGPASDQGKFGGYGKQGSSAGHSGKLESYKMSSQPEGTGYGHGGYQGNTAGTQPGFSSQGGKAMSAGNQSQKGYTASTGYGAQGEYGQKDDAAAQQYYYDSGSDYGRNNNDKDMHSGLGSKGWNAQGKDGGFGGNSYVEDQKTENYGYEDNQYGSYSEEYGEGYVTPQSSGGRGTYSGDRGFQAGRGRGDNAGRGFRGGRGAGSEVGKTGGKQEESWGAEDQGARGGGFGGIRGAGNQGPRGRGFDGNRGAGYQGGRGWGFDGNSGGGNQGNRGGGFEGNRGRGNQGGRGRGFDGGKGRVENDYNSSNTDQVGDYDSQGNSGFNPGFRGRGRGFVGGLRGRWGGDRQGGDQWQSGQGSSDEGIRGARGGFGRGRGDRGSFRGNSSGMGGFGQQNQDSKNNENNAGAAKSVDDMNTKRKSEEMPQLEIKKKKEDEKIDVMPFIKAHVEEHCTVNPEARKLAEESLKKMMQPCYCVLCNARMSGPPQAMMHYQGKNHNKKIKNFITCGMTKYAEKVQNEENKSEEELQRERMEEEERNRILDAKVAQVCNNLHFRALSYQRSYNKFKLQWHFKVE